MIQPKDCDTLNDNNLVKKCSLTLTNNSHSLLREQLHNNNFLPHISYNIQQKKTEHLFFYCIFTIT